MATIALINPFLHNVHTAFKAYINSTTYHNQELFSDEKQSYMHTILKDIVAYIPLNKEAVNLKHHMILNFTLVHNELHRKSNARHPTS
jgi:hypothetical protein